MPRCWRNKLGPRIVERRRDPPPPSECVWCRELRCTAGEGGWVSLFPVEQLSWEVRAHPRQWCFAIAASSWAFLLPDNWVLRFWTDMERVDEAGLGEANLRARVELGDAMMHFEHSSVKELLFLYVEEFLLSFYEVPHFSATHREDASALELVVAGLEVLGPAEAALVSRGRTGVSRHGLSIPFFQLPETLLQQLMRGLVKSNTILLWPAQMRMDCRLPPEQVTKLLVDGMNEMYAAWEHPVPDSEQFEVLRVCQELALLGAASNPSWTRTQMCLICLGGKCWATTAQKAYSILQIDCWLAEAEIAENTTSSK